MKVRTIYSIEEYEEAVKQNDDLFRWGVASSALWKKILDHNPENKEAVILNKRLPEEILELLACDSDPRIRSMTASKRQITRKIVETLSKDENEAVRLSIASNPKVPKDILETMLNDTWDEIVRVVKERLDAY